MRVLRSNIFVMIFCLLPLIPIWHFDYLPLQDYPNHFARLQILRDYDHSDFYKENFRVEPFRGISPIPNLTLDIFVNSFLPFLDIDTAMRLFISLYIIFYLWSLYLLGKELGLDFSLLLLFNMPLIYSFFFHLGLLGFIFSIPLLLFAVYFLKKYEKGRKVRYIVLFGLFSFIVYITHIISFAVLCIVLFCYFLTKRLDMKGYLYMLLGISPSVFLMINYIFSGTSKNVLLKISPLYKLHMLYITFSHLPLILLIMNSVLFVSAACLILKPSLFRGNFFFYVAVLIFTVYLLAPFDGMSGSYIYGRLFLYSFIMLSFAMDPKEVRQTAFARLLLVVVCLVNFSWLLLSFTDFNKNFSTACAGNIKEQSVLMPVDVTRTGSSIRPYNSSWGYFFRHKEFLVYYLISGIQQQIKYRSAPPDPNQHGNKQNQGDEKAPLRAIREAYDYILVFGKNPEVEARLNSISQKVCSDRMTSLYEIEKPTSPVLHTTKE